MKQIWFVICVLISVATNLFAIATANVREAMRVDGVPVYGKEHTVERIDLRNAIKLGDGRGEYRNWRSSVLAISKFTYDRKTEDTSSSAVLLGFNPMVLGLMTAHTVLSIHTIPKCSVLSAALMKFSFFQISRLASRTATANACVCYLEKRVARSCDSSAMSRNGFKAFMILF